MTYILFRPKGFSFDPKRSENDFHPVSSSGYSFRTKRVSEKRKRVFLSEKNTHVRIRERIPRNPRELSEQKFTFSLMSFVYFLISIFHYLYYSKLHIDVSTFYI